MQKLKGKVSWITGGSRGIGRSIALTFAKEGSDIVISYASNDQAAQNVVAQIQELGVKAMAIRTNVADYEEVVKSHDKIKESFGSVDILVNSAGIIKDNLFILLGVEDWQSVIQTNLLGSVYTCKEVLRGMMQKRWGRIINLSSVAATRGGKGQANYAASKGAIEAMTRSLAAEIGKRNITVNCIAPGVIQTEMTEEVLRLAKDEIMDKQIVKRFGEPEEIAAWAVMLASEQGGFMTGQVLHVDGGLKMA
jgi:3-oxoacyl-[acyl-carrier protein] reductase